MRLELANTWVKWKMQNINQCNNCHLSCIQLIQNGRVHHNLLLIGGSSGIYCRMSIPRLMWSKLNESTRMATMQWLLRGIKDKWPWKSLENDYSPEVLFSQQHIFSFLVLPCIEWTEKRPKRYATNHISPQPVTSASILRKIHTKKWPSFNLWSHVTICAEPTEEGQPTELCQMRL